MSSTEVHSSKKPKEDRTQLRPEEIFWRDRQLWLEQKGYMLRPRYRPGWVASWAGKDAKYWEYEDSKVLKVRTSHLCLRIILTLYSSAIDRLDMSLTPLGFQMGNW